LYIDGGRAGPYSAFIGRRLHVEALKPGISGQPGAGESLFTHLKESIMANQSSNQGGGMQGQNTTGQGQRKEERQQSGSGLGGQSGSQSGGQSGSQSGSSGQFGGGSSGSSSGNR
jgi:hypothetical protein